MTVGDGMVSERDFPCWRNGVLTGAWRRPGNNSAHEEGTIHDDATAQALGFRGGTIAGSIHMEQFPPLMTRHFGEGWHRSGSLSLWFRTPSYDTEPVRAFLSPLPGGRATVWLENTGGTRVLDGSASIGAPDGDAMVSQKLRDLRPPGDIRMLRHVQVGRSVRDVPTRVAQRDIDVRLPILTEQDPAFEDPSRWGGTLVPLSAVIHALRVVEPPLAPVQGAEGGEFVGLFGAITLQFLNGPMVAERDYRVRGRVVAVADTPKTEMFWYEAIASDPVTGQDIVSTLHMSRLMKASSRVWAGEVA